MKRKKNKKNKKNNAAQNMVGKQLQYRKAVYRMIIVIVATLTLMGIFLPGWLLVWENEGKVDMVNAAPVEYYSPANLAVARNASANLGIYQKLQLITGKWKSENSQVDSNERQMEDFEAVGLAKEQLEELYLKGLYPVSLMSDYGNWYSFEAEYCKVVDATFHTYAAYYWNILFEKYDGSKRHRVYMLEDGTIFLAEAWGEDGMDSSGMIKVSDMEIESRFKDKTIVKQKGNVTDKDLTECLSYGNIEAADLTWMDLLQLQVGEQEYHLLQANSKSRYLYSLQPAN